MVALQEEVSTHTIFDFGRPEVSNTARSRPRISTIKSISITSRFSSRTSAVQCIVFFFEIWHSVGMQFPFLTIHPCVEIEQALSSMALDGYSRLSAGAVWLVIHVYVRVHSAHNEEEEMRCFLYHISSRNTRMGMPANCSMLRSLR